MTRGRTLKFSTLNPTASRMLTNGPLRLAALAMASQPLGHKHETTNMSHNSAVDKSNFVSHLKANKKPSRQRLQ